MDRHAPVRLAGPRADSLRDQVVAFGDFVARPAASA
jgi:hypothetical protein